MKRRLISLTIALLLTSAGIYFLNTTQHTTDPTLSIAGSTMGTSYHLKIVSPPNQPLDRVLLEKKIQARLDEIDHKMSTYKTDSDLSRFNRHPINDWAPISAETFAVIAAGQKISEQSAGAFDITVGKLVNLWGFGPTINATAVPDADSIHSLQQQIGYHKLELQAQPPALLKHTEQVYVDLSAIAKGYAVDAIATLLDQHNINNYLVEIGGEIRTRGVKDHNLPWVIGIESPTTNERSVQRLLHLGSAAMATSGDYRNYFEHQGKRFSHTIDPRTGYPIEHKLASVTVIADDCMTADALATALMVLGPEKGLQFAEQQHLAVFMIIKHNDGFIERQSSAFSPYLHR